ncbi:XkdX family protein [Clostridium sp. M14]|uniref:XkdX family protein n=1 Tax=Clostridium sp. M14 TaxID=2716311 RepID=UPI0013EEC10F|nr:XkdX family protein [Clostridium sp. M14]MBZ9693207.1 XkdX family protein [Clostridium sp. M14]
MEFWKMVFDMKVCDANFIRQAVITEKNKFGDITIEQFKEITGEDFIKVISQ